MNNLELNKTILIANSENRFAVTGEAFIASMVSIDSETGVRNIIVQSINIGGVDSDFKKETFSVSEEKLFDIFEVAEEDIDDLEFPNKGKGAHIQLSELEQAIFGRVLSEDERRSVMGEIGVAYTTKELMEDIESLVGNVYLPKKDFYSFVAGKEYELIEVAVGDSLKGVVYVFKTDVANLSFKTNQDLKEFFLIK